MKRKFLILPPPSPQKRPDVGPTKTTFSGPRNSNNCVIRLTEGLPKWWKVAFGWNFVFAVYFSVGWWQFAQVKSSKIRMHRYVERVTFWLVDTFQWAFRSDLRPKKKKFLSPLGNWRATVWSFRTKQRCHDDAKEQFLAQAIPIKAIVWGTKKLGRKHAWKTPSSFD